MNAAPMPRAKCSRVANWLAMTNRNTTPSSTMNQEVYTRSAVSPYPSMYSASCAAP